MVIYVIVETFLLAFPMNKFASNVMDGWNLDEINANYWHKVYFDMYHNIIQLHDCVSFYI